MLRQEEARVVLGGVMFHRMHWLDSTPSIRGQSYRGRLRCGNCDADGDGKDGILLAAELGMILSPVDMAAY